MKLNEEESFYFNSNGTFLRLKKKRLSKMLKRDAKFECVCLIGVNLFKL